MTFTLVTSKSRSAFSSIKWPDHRVGQMKHKRRRNISYAFDVPPPQHRVTCPNPPTSQSLPRVSQIEMQWIITHLAFRCQNERMISLRIMNGWLIVGTDWWNKNQSTETDPTARQRIEGEKLFNHVFSFL